MIVNHERLRAVLLGQELGWIHRCGRVRRIISVSIEDGGDVFGSA